MARLSLSMLSGTSMTIALVAMSMLVAVFVNMGLGSQESGATTASAAPSPADSMSLMQGVNVQIDRLSIYEKELDMLAQDTDAHFSEAPGKPKPSRVSLIGSNINASAHLLAARLGVQSSFGMVVVMVLLVVMVLCAASTFLFSWRRGQQGNRQNSSGFADAFESREKMIAHTSPLQPNRMYQRGAPGAPASAASLPGGHSLLGPDTSLPSGSFLPAPRDMGPSSRTSITDQQRQTAKPPPLCPTLVMPMSEALLGIQMFELAQLSDEGSLNVVGMSGKPLLRAEIKKVGDMRFLEISMPEPNSIPRATIGPPSAASSQQHGSRALEIRGMRGSFYGVLEMRTSGACFVVKDGQTVLTIDGDAESLQLSLKSTVGLQLASVRCSTEQFDGVDHVELRVEPGVDTVLVTAVVLAVLLLSPYLPPGGSDDFAGHRMSGMVR